jgi:hypothetical protein
MDIRCPPNALSSFSKCFLSQEISLESKSVKYEIHKSLNHCVNEIITQLMCTNSESISQRLPFLRHKRCYIGDWSVSVPRLMVHISFLYLRHL